MKMKSVQKSSKQTNLVKSFWQNVRIDGRVMNLAEQFRIKINMPAKGFESTDNFEQWKEDLCKENGSDDARVNNFNDFETEVTKTVPHIGVLSDMAFRKLLIIFYYYNSIEDEDYEDLRFSEFEVVTIEDNQPIIFHKAGIKDGVYIKIGPKTSIKQIKEFLDAKSARIRDAQRFFLDVTKPVLVQKLKSHPNFARDNMMVWLNRLDKKALEEIGGFGNTKEEIIANIIKDVTNHKKILNSGVVKTVLQRRRKMNRTLKGLQ